jgi:hypothetical protein
MRNTAVAGHGTALVSTWTAVFLTGSPQVVGWLRLVKEEEGDNR